MRRECRGDCRHTPITDDVRKRWVQRYNDGMDSAAIARGSGVSPSTVRSYLDSIGVSTARKLLPKISPAGVPPQLLAALKVLRDRGEVIVKMSRQSDFAEPMAGVDGVGFFSFRQLYQKGWADRRADGNGRWIYTISTKGEKVLRSAA